MPRNSRFENKRVAKLLGLKIKPIFKSTFPALPIDSKIHSYYASNCRKTETMHGCRFDSSNYITLHKHSLCQKTVLKRIYRIYRDQQVFENLSCSEGMNGVYHRDSESPIEHIKSDADFMRRSLKQALSQQQQQRNESDAIYEEQENICNSNLNAKSPHLNQNL